MPRSTSNILALLALVLIVTAGAEAQDDNDRDALARQIAERVETLQTLRAERRRLDHLHQQQRQSAARVVDSLEADLADAKSQLAEQTDTLESLREQQAARQQRIDQARQWIGAVVDIVQPMAASFAQRIENGIPVDREARARPFAAADDLSEPADATSAISDVFEHAGDDIALGRSVELTNTPLVLDGGARQQHAWRLRIGLANALFASETGHTFGLWSGDADAPWRDQLPADVAGQIDRVFEVVREQQPPNLIPTPTPVGAATTSGSEKP